MNPSQPVQAEHADLGDVPPAELRRQCLRPQPGAVTYRAGTGDDETLHQPASALVVAAQRPLDRGDSVVIVHRQPHRPLVPARVQRHLPLHGRAVQHDVALALGERLVRHVEAHPELARGIHRQPPPAGVPRQHRPLLDRLVRIGHQGGFVDLRPHAQALAGRARAVGVEGKGFGTGMFKVRTADRADDLLGKRRDRRADAVAVRAQVRAQPRHHQPQDVQDFGHGPDGAARSWNRRPLPQGKRGRQVIDPVHVRALCLGQPAAAVGAQAREVSLHAFGVQGADGERRLARSGHADDGDRAPQRHVDVDVAQVVMPGAAHADGIGQRSGTESARAVIVATYAGRRRPAPGPSISTPGVCAQAGGQGEPDRWARSQRLIGRYQSPGPGSPDPGDAGSPARDRLWIYGHGIGGSWFTLVNCSGKGRDRR